MIHGMMTIGNIRNFIHRRNQYQTPYQRQSFRSILECQSLCSGNTKQSIPIWRTITSVSRPLPSMSEENVKELRTFGEELLEEVERIKQIGEKLV
ncbi:hypothetical protein Hanom_Chr04g00298351 [Helianthus anomalus]